MKTGNQLQLVTYEQARRLKKVGFDWEYFYYYRSDGIDIEQNICPVNWNRGQISDFFVNAPVAALALKWFRDTTGIISSIDCLTPVNSLEPPVFGYKIFMERDGHTTRMYGSFATFEAAESALLDELLNIIEKQSLFIDVKQPEIEEI